MASHWLSPCQEKEESFVLLPVGLWCQLRAWELPLLVTLFSWGFCLFFSNSKFISWATLSHTHFCLFSVLSFSLCQQPPRSHSDWKHHSYDLLFLCHIQPSAKSSTATQFSVSPRPGPAFPGALSSLGRVPTSPLRFRCDSCPSTSPCARRTASLIKSPMASHCLQIPWSFLEEYRKLSRFCL